MYSLVVTEETPNDFSWNECATLKPFIVEVLDVTMDPSPFKKGENVTIISKVDVKKPVENGKWKISVNYGPITVLTQGGDNCDKCDCPCSGDQTLDIVLAIPSYSPNGQYGGIFEIYQENSIQRLGCINFKFIL